MKRVLLLVAALFMVAGVAYAQDCDCDWEALVEDFADTGYSWMLDYFFAPEDWDALEEYEGEVGGTVEVEHDGFEDLLFIVHADCSLVTGWDDGFWATWDQFDPGTLSIPDGGDDYSPFWAETLEERHFGLYVFSGGDSLGQMFTICPAAAAPSVSASITGPHNVDVGAEVVLEVVTEGLDEGTETYLWDDDSTEATRDLGVVDGGDTGVYTCEVSGDVDGEALEEPLEASFTLWVGVATPLAGGLGLGLLAGACALAGVVSIRRKK